MRFWSAQALQAPEAELLDSNYLCDEDKEIFDVRMLFMNALC